MRLSASQPRGVEPDVGSTQRSNRLPEYHACSLYSEAEGMRNRTVLISTLAVLLLALPSFALPTPAAAADIPMPRVYWTLVAFDDGGTTTRFQPQNKDRETVILVPQVPVVLNITLIYRGKLDHTFTIKSTAANPPSPNLVNVNLPMSLGTGNSKSVEFTIFAKDRIVFGSRNETVEKQGARIRFFCQPHESGGMVGYIAFGGATEATESPALGVFLRAYWIGLLGIAATLLLTVISYFVIKGSSRHYRDHHEHIRRGGP